MTIALFGNKFNENFNAVIHSMLEKLFKNNHKVFIYTPLYEFIKAQQIFQFEFSGFFGSSENLPKNIDFMISIGGDGTFLEAITCIRDSGLPLVGINSGRLGFLANIASSEVDHAIENLITKNYSIEERRVLKLQSNNHIFNDFPFALNDFTVQRTGSSLISIHITIDGNFLNSYWTDGVIISTPTGSTAYSLSLGGPIVTPNSHNFIITPIGAHNLNVRPLVIPDSAQLKLKVEGRTYNLLATLDSRSVICPVDTEINITRASFCVRMIKLPQLDYYSTLRNKLMWGADKRN
jgi:NAD+ kinase